MSAYDTELAFPENTMKTDPTSTISTLTQVAAGDDRTVYDNFSIFLHWLTVLLVVSQFALAETWKWFARPTRHLLIVAHMSFGIILAAVIVIRIIWRLIPDHRMSPAVSGWTEMASKAVHYLLRDARSRGRTGIRAALGRQ
jgi:cytochrome b561